MWNFIRKFVDSRLAIDYKFDVKLATDYQIQNWGEKIRSAGKLSSFPIIKTVDQIIDVVIMCVQIRSPSHKAVNYLQNLYTFDINNPLSLRFEPPPWKFTDLLSQTERELELASHINQ